MDVRAAGPADIAPLLKLYRDLQPDDEDLDIDVALARWEMLRRYPGSDIFVGRLGSQLVTTCTLVVIPNLTRNGAPYALIENVVTGAGHRRRGFGKAVLIEAINAAWAAECYKVMLLTGSTQPGTLKFYHDVGFEQNKTGFQIRHIPPRPSA